MTNSADPGQKPTDLDLHCLLRQGMSCLAREGLIDTWRKGLKKIMICLGYHDSTRFSSEINFFFWKILENNRKVV